MLKSLGIAFQTYSRIPIPAFMWDEKSLRYAICYFPVIGIVIGGVECLWFWLASLLHVPNLVGAAIAAAIPLLLTGGIHMDGFCDTVDALSSQQDQERRLEILKDSHAGAFAIIFAGVWLLLDFASWSAIDSWRMLGAVCCGFVLSRALSGLALAVFQGARKKGMLQGFADSADKRCVIITMIVFAAAAAAGMMVLASWKGFLMVTVSAFLFYYYRTTAYKKFGGTTGDLAGWFLQLSELGTVLVAAIFTWI